MSDWLDALAYMDLIDPIDGFVSTFRYADWRGAYDRAGIAGVAAEFFASLAAINCWTIWVQRHAGWSGAKVEALLMRHGVRIWGRGFVGERIFFRVKKRQARWAEYLLLRCGVPVAGALFDPRNQDYADRFTTASEPPNRRERTDGDWLDRLARLLRSL